MNHAEIVNRGGRNTIGVKRNVEIFVNEEIVSLTHDTKIVDEPFLNSASRTSEVSMNACR